MSGAPPAPTFARVTSAPPFTVREVAAFEFTTSSRPTVPPAESIVTVPPATARSMFPATVPMSMAVAAVTVAPILKSMSPADVPRVMPPPLVTSAPISMAPATFAESIVMEEGALVPPMAPFISTPVTFVTFRAPVMSTVPLKMAWPALPPSTVNAFMAVPPAPTFARVTLPPPFTNRDVAAFELTTSSRTTVPFVESMVTVLPSTIRSMFPAMVSKSTLPAVALMVIELGICRSPPFMVMSSMSPALVMLSPTFMSDARARRVEPLATL